MMMIGALQFHSLFLLTFNPKLKHFTCVLVVNERIDDFYKQMQFIY